MFLKRDAKIRTFLLFANFFRVFSIILYPEMTGEKKISLWQLFWVMAKIGSFTIGGGYAMLLIIQKEITSRGWISEEEFPDLIAL